MDSAVIIDGVRTPIGRADPVRGYYRQRRSDELLAECFRGLLERTGLPAEAVEDVVVGCAKQTLQQGANVARAAALMAGLPDTAAATTVNRLCGSGLQALNQAVHAIAAGAEDVQLVGGLEHMHHLPLGAEIDIHPGVYARMSPDAMRLGCTAEWLAGRRGITRAEQDAFAARSHWRAAAAHAQGWWAGELLATRGLDTAGLPALFDRDQGVRPEITLEALARLPAVFQPRGGTVTAGNSSPQSVGAAALVVMSASRARQLGLTPLVRVVATAVAGIAPSAMGLGPAAAARKALERARLTPREIDLWELNEAFAAQCLACVRELDLDEERVNIRGGAIALGHPLGASGVRIAVTLIHALRDSGARRGLAAVCIGMGQGIATVFEQV